MVELFSWTTAQYGLAVGLLLVGVIFLWKLASSKDKALIARYDKENAELRVERDLYRDRWIKTIETAEVADEAAARLAGRRRRAGGS